MVSEQRDSLCRNHGRSKYCSRYFVYPAIATEVIQDECETITQKGLRRSDDLNPSDSEIFKMFPGFDHDRLLLVIPYMCNVVYTVDETRMDPSTPEADRRFLLDFCPGSFRVGVVHRIPGKAIDWYRQMSQC